MDSEVMVLVSVVPADIVFALMAQQVDVPLPANLLLEILSSPSFLVAVSLVGSRRGHRHSTSVEKAASNVSV